MVKKSSLFPQLPPYLQLYIFDKKILPILLYASEVWGSMDIAEIETIHYKFCKYVFGLPYHSVNYVALGELGRVPISILSIYRKIKYWFKIIKHTDYRFTTSKYHRSLLTKFRCGVLDLEINKGRHHNIPREHRLCTYCNLGKVEDEFHFLLECPCYSELRLIYFPRHFYITPNLISFSEMMKTTNKSLLYKICIFLEKGLKYRAEIDSYFQ